MTDAFGGIGGIAKFNRDVLTALAEMPECCRIIAFPRLVQRESEPIPPNVDFRLDASEGKLAYIGAVLQFVVSSYSADIVICGHLNLLPLAWLVSSAKRCPLLVIVHGIEAWRPHQSLLVRQLIGRVDHVAAVSRFTAERLAAWAGLRTDHVRILPNCVDLAVFSPRPRNARIARAFGLDGRRVLLTVGRLAGKDRFKGFDEVMEVLPVLTREISELTYVIVGDGEDRARLERKAMELGVVDHVVFTGYVTEEEKLDFYALADAYVMPSRGEGFGIVFLEAMACGVPVIGSASDGSREALLDGELGLLVDPDDPDALLQAIREALARPRGRPCGLEYFDAIMFRERLVRLVREVAARAAR
ncbi:MAG: glycosyltransferase family 4 protein [Sulfuricaulis sp.]|uniref:glycosyltransferase family 4 protein n=1 Tax=Sulfuricaulis sp. TaxID=2003553 RepID=UPI0034A2D9A6